MEIERKFLVKVMPDLSHIAPIEMERYYLPAETNEEIRIQRVGASYSYERKIAISVRGRSKEIRRLTKSEYDDLKTRASSVVTRASYSLGSGLSIKVYGDQFEGLVRAEQEFESERRADAYTPESWMGKEITDTPLGRDSRLL